MLEKADGENTLSDYIKYNLIARNIRLILSTNCDIQYLTTSYFIEHITPMKAQKHVKRGDHTTYIELATEVIGYISKNFDGVSFSAGIIIQGIKAKHNKITLTPLVGFVVMMIVMKHAKQEVRLFSIDPNKLFRQLKNEYQGVAFVQINN